MRYAILYILLHLSFLTSAHSQEQKCPMVEGADCTKMVLGLKEIAKLAREKYSYYEEKFKPNLTLQTLISRSEYEISERTSWNKYYIILSIIAAAFNDGHVKIQYRDGLVQKNESPIRFQYLDFNPGSSDASSKIIVSPLSDLKGTNLKPGDIVTHFRGKNLSSLIRDTSVIASASTPQMKNVEIAKRMTECYGADCPDNPEILYNTPRLYDENLAMIVKQANKMTGNTFSAEINAEIRQHGNNKIGYIRTDKFDWKIQEKQLDNLLAQLNDVQTIVLDLRYNSGGDQFLGDKLLSLRNKSTTNLVRYYYTEKIGDNKFSPLKPSVVLANIKNTVLRRVPLVILTGPECYSSCDTLVSAFKINKLAVIVGQATGGGSGMPGSFELANTGFSISLPMQKIFDASQTSLIEGRGTMPDVIINPKIEDLRDMQDSQKINAIIYAGDQLEKIRNGVQ